MEMINLTMECLIMLMGKVVGLVGVPNPAELFRFSAGVLISN